MMIKIRLSDKVFSATKPAVAQFMRLNRSFILCTLLFFCRDLSAEPNLRPFQPVGWSDEIVISLVRSNRVDAQSITSADILYVSWAVANMGTTATTGRFNVELYIDGTRYDAGYRELPLNSGFYVSVEDVGVGPVDVGLHRLTLAIDSASSIHESNEDDNVFVKEFSVSDDDPTDQLHQAIPLGAISQTRISSDNPIDTPLDVDIYALSVRAGQRISFDIDQAGDLNPYIRLFSSNGVHLASNDDGTGPVEPATLNSYLEHTFTESGTFFLGVSGYPNTNYNAVTGRQDRGGSIGNYTLVVSPGIAGHIRRDITDYPVQLMRVDDPVSPIDPSAKTWIIIHGWNSSPAKENISSLVTALLQRQPDDQVLTLDWSQVAATGVLDPFTAEKGIPLVAGWGAAALRQYGFSGTNLSLIGHSFGSYVADEIAELIPGGVNTITGLDPAENVLLGYNSNASVDFGLHSLFSWAFYSSDPEGVGGILGANYGNEETPTTADEAFVVRNSTHGDIVFLFSWIITNPLLPFSHFFSTHWLLSGALGPWIPDQYGYGGRVGGLYEAVIDASDGGRTAEGILYSPRPSLELSRTASGVMLVWVGTSGTFQIESSTFLRPNEWSAVNAEPTQLGTTNVMSLQLSAQHQFFRLKKRN